VKNIRDVFEIVISLFSGISGVFDFIFAMSPQ
jgi:hypothetical protein